MHPRPTITKHLALEARTQNLPPGKLLPTVKAMANRQDDDKDQGDDDTKHDELDLHVLKPHLPPHRCSLLPEVLCLWQSQNQMIVEQTMR